MIVLDKSMKPFGSYYEFFMDHKIHRVTAQQFLVTSTHSFLRTLEVVYKHFDSFN